ncbi:hypothetical protein HOLDEFILI_01975 [Holdemania filiformis DSM 12042]|uniref:Uncharacterized protein n=1 Tax=Holdemania filiformis DSM 12042 TaxID=545696 RepID=B9Y829_9FIRM|nr:hypothetical protein HOLDEFILI_01975 [Holdemania filiformis DSM 12042]
MILCLGYSCLKDPAILMQNYNRDHSNSTFEGTLTLPRRTAKFQN